MMYIRAMSHLVPRLRRTLLVLTSLILVLTGTACGTHHTASPAPPVPTLAAPVQPSASVTFYELAGTKQQIKSADANGLIATTSPVPPKTMDPALLAIQRLVASKNSPLPRGTRLRSLSVDRASGMATIDFSKEFVDNFPGGDEREAQVLDSVLATLGQFPEINSVQFLVAGAKVGSLGGTQDLTSPLPAIRASQMLPGDGSGSAKSTGGANY